VFHPGSLHARNRIVLTHNIGGVTVSDIVTSSLRLESLQSQGKKGR